MPLIYPRAYEALQYRLRSLAGGRFANHCRPAGIQLLLTERCNARCVHCDIWRNQGEEDSLASDEWKTFLTDVRSWLGPVFIVLTGGEALLKPYTVELASYASSLGLVVEVLTNGYWPDQTRIERLALANPYRITVSLDSVGQTHSTIRGRADFFEQTSRTIDTLLRVREARNLGYRIRLKTVIMEHNLDALSDVARFATRDGMEVIYQPIEQNYNTRTDPHWFETSPNWPRHAEHAVARIQELIDLKKLGRVHIGNTVAQLEAMIPYFRNPAPLQQVVRAHVAHERRIFCAALTLLQIQANGDVTVCSNKPPVGNIRRCGIRSIWKQRPRWWEGGCCMEAPESSQVHA